MPFCQIGCKFTTKIAYTQILGALFGKNRVYSMISGVRRNTHACMVWACVQLKSQGAAFSRKVLLKLAYIPQDANVNSEDSLFAWQIRACRITTNFRNVQDFYRKRLHGRTYLFFECVVIIVCSIWIIRISQVSHTSFVRKRIITFSRHSRDISETNTRG